VLYGSEMDVSFFQGDPQFVFLVDWKRCFVLLPGVDCEHDEF